MQKPAAAGFSCIAGCKARQISSYNGKDRNSAKYSDKPLE